MSKVDPRAGKINHISRPLPAEKTLHSTRVNARDRHCKNTVPPISVKLLCFLFLKQKTDRSDHSEHVHIKQKVRGEEMGKTRSDERSYYVVYL